MRPGALKLIAFIDEISPRSTIWRNFTYTLEQPAWHWRDSFLERKEPEYLRTINDEVARIVGELVTC